jgi:mono/diheme cytochrome c family protein
MPPVTAALLARGQERFDIFCAPCHSIAGDGDGFIARRGFPHPPSYHSDRLRSASDAHLYAVITDGYGAMYPYARRLAPADRIAVVAYVRALQLSQHAPLSAVPAAERAQLEARR